MRRGLVAAGVLVGLVVAVEVAAGWSGERTVSEALCGAEVDLGPPVVLRVLTGRTVPFEARFTEADLERLVPLPALVTGVVVEDDRLSLRTTAGLSVPADLRFEAGMVSVTPTLGVLELDRLALRYDLADILPTGVEVDRLEVDGDAVLAAGRGDPRGLTATGVGRRCVS